MVEVMVVVSIVVIFMSIAMPSFTSVAGRIKVKSVTSEIYAALLKTRSEAMMRNMPMVASAKSGGWKSGWTISDPAGGSAVLDDKGPLAGVSITGPGSVTFNPSGRLPPTATPAFTISSNGANATTACISVDLSGRPYTKFATAC